MHKSAARKRRRLAKAQAHEKHKAGSFEQAGLESHPGAAPVSDTFRALSNFLGSRPIPTGGCPVVTPYIQDSCMLLLAGRRPSTMTPALVVDLPPCKNGFRCVGVTQRLKGFTEAEEGAALMSLMTVKELRVLMTTGIKPQKSAPCLLCYRFELTYLIYAFGHSGTPLHRDIELSSSYCDTGPGEYHPRACHMPGEYAYIGIRRPVPAFRLDMLEVKTDASGHRYVCQERMGWNFHQGTAAESPGGQVVATIPPCPVSATEHSDEDDSEDLFSTPIARWSRLYPEEAGQQPLTFTDQPW